MIATCVTGFEFFVKLRKRLAKFAVAYSWRFELGFCMLVFAVESEVCGSVCASAFAILGAPLTQERDRGVPVALATAQHI